MATNKSSLFNRHTLVVTTLCLISAAIIAFLMSSLKLNPTQKKSALTNKPAPAFEALKISKKTKEKIYLNSQDFKGKPLVIHFWASWCSSCSEDSVFLNKIYPELEKKGIHLIGIAISDDYESAYNQYKNQHKKYLVGFDESGNIALDFGITGVPETFFINKEGKLVYRHTGPLTEKIFVKYMG